ncbi:type I-C CRISPR-associated protein Cas8c/Csd1 [Kurthia senegalensis]|uniref:type I-C CRISPR-associated protein Cas8c/Csd1 n=1 Tax=Kurthia senegalensis TaxID=1033740 RepID=UPI00028A2232|nr:type I-C CRISPR-associated protein Cas8c/Csd1 [Kurthia senegalensis]
MTFFQSLLQTYEANADRVGKVELKYVRGQAIPFMLLPVSHMTQTAHIEVRLTCSGEWITAVVLSKVNTVIPFTEQSGMRAGKSFMPHMLHDKLMYVAGDYDTYTGEAKKEGFDRYIEQLANWCQQPGCPPEVQAIYAYVQKARLIEDLVAESILHVDERGHLLKKWSGADKPPIFQQLVGEQSTAFVRFTVEGRPPVWENEEMFNSYRAYTDMNLQERGLCYVTGAWMPVTKKHPSKLRNVGDRAKLISCNDRSGFTFRGRFLEAEQVATMGYDVSQKAHHALQWLIERQGKMIDDRVFLTWGDTVGEVDTGIEKRRRILRGEATEQLGASYMELLRTRENRWSERLHMLVLDAATPGRLAILYERTFSFKAYYEQLSKWHTELAWHHTYFDADLQKNVTYVGAPMLESIAQAIDAPNPHMQFVKSTVQRLLPCMLDGRAIPIDLVKQAIARASNPNELERYDWEWVLAVACSFVKYEAKAAQECYTMDLQRYNTDRSYLYGRLLALSDYVEKKARRFSSDSRLTNALRLMDAFRRNPKRTWQTLAVRLQLDAVRLQSRFDVYAVQINDIIALFEADDFNDEALTGLYLLGYYSQRQSLYRKKVKAGDSDDIFNEKN